LEADIKDEVSQDIEDIESLDSESIDSDEPNLLTVPSKSRRGSNSSVISKTKPSPYSMQNKLMPNHIPKINRNKNPSPSTRSMDRSPYQNKSPSAHSRDLSRYRDLSPYSNRISPMPSQGGTSPHHQ